MTHSWGKGHGEKWSRKKDVAILALISETTVNDAAAKAGVSVSTLKRWQQRPEFQAAYEKARRGLVEQAFNRVKSSMTMAVDALTDIVKNAPKEGDRSRAAVALLQFGLRSVELADPLQPPDSQVVQVINGVDDVVDCLAEQLVSVCESQLGTVAKTRLISQLSNDIVRAMNTETLQRRIQAIEAVLKKRKEPKQ